MVGNVSGNNSRYLPHVDGLRSVALVAVLAYHLNIPRCQGGFVGVDMFFCLSGYLITRNIEHDKRTGKFSIFNFYKNRFLRLHPALTFTVMFTVLLSAFFFDEDNFLGVLRSGRAALLIHANAYFHRTWLYFDVASYTVPLLHTWSLSLEEQFYLFWALFLSVRLQRRVKIALVAIFSCLSFHFSVVQFDERQLWTFYELPGRVFQFGFGALLALFELPEGVEALPSEAEGDRSVKERHSLKNMLARLSDLGERKVLFNVSMYEITEFFLHNAVSIWSAKELHSAFTTLPKGALPIKVLPVSFHTILLIKSHSSIISRFIFSNAAMKYIGKLSYSIYLVHWPIIAFGTLVEKAILGKEVSKVFYVAVILLLSILLKTFVEDPFRSDSRQKSFAFVFLITFMFLSCVLSLGLNMPAPKISSGFPSKESCDGIQAGLKEITKLSETEHAIDMHKIFAGDLEKGKRANMIFVGDSFIHHLLPCLSFIGKKHRLYFETYFRFARPFVSKNYSGTKPMTPFWKTVNGYQWDLVANTSSEDHVVVANFYGYTIREYEVKQFIRQLAADFASLNRSFTVVGHTAGVDPKIMSNFLACRNMMSSPLVTKLGLRALIHGTKDCIQPESGNKLPPHPFSSYNNALRDATNERDNVNFLDLTASICSDTNVSGIQRRLCTIPPKERDAFYELGYKHDAFHLNCAGSFHLRKTMDEFVRSKLSLK